MRIDFKNGNNQNLTMANHELHYLSTWMIEHDAAAIHFEGKDYLWFEGQYYGRPANDPDFFWHPTQLIIDLARMARTKSLKYLRNWVLDKQPIASPVPAFVRPAIPKHLTVLKGDHQYITGFSPSLDILTFRLPDGTQLIRIKGDDVDMTDDADAQRHGAASLIEYWEQLPVGQFVNAVHAFCAKHNLKDPLANE